MKSRLRSLLTFVIGWPLSLIALFFIIRLISPHMGELQSNLKNINYGLIALGTLCFIIYFFLRSYTYQKILNFLGYPLTLRDSAFYWGQSELHRYVPGNVWSFLGRTMLFAKKEVEKKDIASSLIIESQLVLLGTLLVTLLGVPFLLATFLPGITNTRLLFIGAVLIVGILTTMYIYSEKLSKGIKFPLVRRLLFAAFTPQQNMLLVFVAFWNYLFFGLGYFFIMSSIFPLHPQKIWELSGFFAFSLLVGYASLITPTGLGIREGILILGLRSMTTTAIVGFASIFTRIILVISEIAYLLFTYIWHETRHKKWFDIEAYVSKHKHLILLSLMIVIYIFYISLVSFLRYDNYYTGRFDLGNMAQTVWNTSQGNIFMFTNPNGVEEVSRLAFHADFILILLAPLYFLWSDPRMLLFVQAIITGMGALFVYLLAQKILKGRTLPLIIAAVFLLNPSLQRANIYDFHAVTLATTFLLGAFYFLLQKRNWAFITFLFLAAITKEQVWLIVAFFGVYCLIKKQFLMGTALIGTGIVMFSFLLYSAIPNAAGSQHFALAYYSDFGDKPGAVVKNIIFSPHKTLPILFEKDRLIYLQQIFGPVGFLAALSPLYLLFASGDIGINLLSNNPQLHQIYYQYTAIISSFLFIATIFGIKRLRSFFPDITRPAIAIYLILMALYTAYLYGPLPGSKDPNLAMFTNPLKNREKIDSYLASIPQSESVAASNSVGSHLSHRKNIYVLPLGIKEADTIVIIPDSTTPGSEGQQTLLRNQLRNDPAFRVVYELDNFIVFKKIQKSDTIN